MKRLIAAGIVRAGKVCPILTPEEQIRKLGYRYEFRVVDPVAIPADFSIRRVLGKWQEGAAK